jgi:hypothetical protein
MLVVHFADAAGMGPKRVARLTKPHLPASQFAFMFNKTLGKPDAPWLIGCLVARLQRPEGSLAFPWGSLHKAGMKTTLAISGICIIG